MDVPMHSSPAHPHGADKTDLHGGIALGIAVLAALIVVNSPLGPAYHALLETTGQVQIGSIGLAQSLEHWINDGLMAIFFLLVGLEIKREVRQGSLANPRSAALPVIAAIGGFAAPAVIYATLNWSSAAALRGWAVSSATDIAFVLAVCAVLGQAIPASLKTFLLALAIIDDLMAIIVIAIFYTDALSVLSLQLALLGLGGLVVLNWLDLRKPTPYVIVGLFTWICVLRSGVHASLAGVAVGFAIPLTRHAGRSLLDDVEHALKPWVSCVVVPVFAFANAGVPLTSMAPSSLLAPIPLGIAAGLCFGKQLGVFLPSIAAIKLGLARLPTGATVLQLYGMAVLTGVGFTMSLFIGTLAFDDETTIATMQLAVLVASVVSAVVAAAILMIAAGRRPPKTTP